MTPNPKIQHINKKLISNLDNSKFDKLKKEEVWYIKNKYKKLKIKNKAPNWVQKNIKYDASIDLRVLAYLYKIKKEGTNKNSYDKKNSINESVKNKINPNINIMEQ